MTLCLAWSGEHGMTRRIRPLCAVWTMLDRRTRGPWDCEPRCMACVCCVCVCVCVCVQGILSSFFYKFADTILKKYSSTIATIFTAIMSFVMFGHALTVNFLLGVSIVFISMHQVGHGQARHVLCMP